MDLYHWFWNEKFWLPQNLTWEDLKRTEEKQFGETRDLWLTFPLCITVLCIRFSVEKGIARPLGKWLNLSERLHNEPKDNIILEKVYKTITRKPNYSQVEDLCKQTGWRKHEINVWFRKKNLVGRPTTLTKFQETFWRFAFYLTSFFYGLYVMYDQECVWQTEKCFSNYPEDHVLSQKIYYYYLIELAFYSATTLTQFFDVKRKDFWEMFIHHIVTIILLCGSYTLNYTKMGAFILVVHDSADFYIEFAKMGKYANNSLVTNVGFISFTISFFLSRLVILPLWIVPSIWFYGIYTYNCAMAWLFCALLILQLLHFYWFSHIVKAAYASILVGVIERDTRSESEDSSAEDETAKYSVGSGDYTESNGIHKRVVTAR